MTRKALFIALLFAALLSRGSAQTFNRPYCSLPYVVTPGHAIELVCWLNAYGDSARSVTMRGDLVPVSANEAVSLALREIPSGAILARARVDGATFALKARQETSVMLNPPRPGAYVVRLYENDTYVQTLSTTVSRFGIITMYAGSATLFAPIDLSSETLYEGPLDVAMRSGDHVEPLQRTADGIYVESSGTSQDTRALEAVGTDQSIAVLQTYQYGMAPPYHRVYGQTDRPLYHPGDRVQFRAILRSGEVGDYHIDRGPVVVNVMQDYPQRLVARRTLRPDSFGVISTAVTLPSDAQLGFYTFDIPMDSGAGAMPQAIASFKVEAYKKPEYTLDVAPQNPAPIAGDDAVFNARFSYLSGADASHVTLHYAATTSYWMRPWYGPFGFYAGNGGKSDSASGDVTTDANGNAAIRIPTKPSDIGGNVYLTVEARDESGRTVTQNINVTLVPGTFRFLVEPEHWVAEAKTATIVTVQATTNDGRSRSNQSFHVAIVERRWRGRRGYDDIDRGTVDLRTGPDGKARFSYTPPEAGVYRFDVRGTDERGHTIAVSQYQWAFDPNSRWAPNLSQPELIPAKTQFHPGETLEATLVLLHPARQAIVAVSTDHLIEHRVVDVRGLSADIRVDAPPNAQVVSITACVPDENGASCATNYLGIEPATRLVVHAVADKPVYRPGDRARFRIHVDDSSGRPVRAELSLGVVDEGIYALSGRPIGDPNQAFYEIYAAAWGQGDWARPNAHPASAVKMIAKVTSRSGIAFQPSSVTDTYSVNGTRVNGVAAGQASLDRVALRKNFLDTAYWSPDIVTDAHGNATATFAWPENLTTWRASTVAATVATQFGSQNVDVLVTKPLMARLEMPRFLRAGDSALITGIVHGPTAGMHVRMQLDPNILASPQPPVSVTLDDARRASATWPVRSHYVGSVDLALRAAGGSDSDGMQLPLPLLGATPLEHVRSAGSVVDAASVPVDLGPNELAGALHLSFSPSMIAQLAQTVRVFDVYPYYCTEQTSSNGIVAAALMLAGANQNALSLPNNPSLVITKAKARLAELRHGDGGWGWWEIDRSSLFMTAYELYAQGVMDRATHLEGDGMLDNTAYVLASMLDRRTADDSDADVALAAYALSQTVPQRLSSDLVTQLVARMRSADALSLALTGLTAHAIGRNADAEAAAQLLIQRGTNAGGAMFWHDRDWDWRWWSDPIEATALGALLLHQTGHEAQAQRALTFIREQRNGDWWYTTLDTAMASMAIAQIEGAKGTADPDETVRVLVDGHVVKTVRVRSPLPDTSETHVVIPASLMHGAHEVSLERSGSGNLYWDSDFEKYGAANATEIHGAPNGVLAKLFAKPPALSVKREYSVGHSGPWRVGDVVNVTLWITAADAADYVTFEDPFPAGTEYQVPQGQTGSVWRWDGAQFLDDRAAFFLRRLPAGVTEEITYSLRATTVGTFEAPGPSAFASYGPPVETVGTGESVKIVGM